MLRPVILLRPSFGFRKRSARSIATGRCSEAVQAGGPEITGETDYEKNGRQAARSRPPNCSRDDGRGKAHSSLVPTPWTTFPLSTFSVVDSTGAGTPSWAASRLAFCKAGISLTPLSSPIPAPRCAAPSGRPCHGPARRSSGANKSQRPADASAFLNATATFTLAKILNRRGKRTCTCSDAILCT